MRQFKRQIDGGFVDLGTGLSIPDDPLNRHRREIDVLIARGEAEILDADPVPPAGPRNMTAEDVWRVLQGKGILADADLPTGVAKP